MGTSQLELGVKGSRAGGRELSEGRGCSRIAAGEDARGNPGVVSTGCSPGELGKGLWGWGSVGVGWGRVRLLQL